MVEHAARAGSVTDAGKSESCLHIQRQHPINVMLDN